MDLQIKFYKAAFPNEAMVLIFRCSREHPGTNKAMC